MFFGEKFALNFDFEFGEFRSDLVISKDLLISF